MISSMTGFGRGFIQQEGQKMQIDIKSVNSRFTDINVKLPLDLAEYELLIREEIKKTISRGKIEVNVQFEDEKNKMALSSIDKTKVRAYKHLLEEIGQEINYPMVVRPEHLLRFNDIFSTNQMAKSLDQNISFLLNSTLEIALERFILHRKKEGSNISENIFYNLSQITSILKEIKNLAPSVMEIYRKKLKDKLKEAFIDFSNDKISEERIILEMVIYADKTDITEEIDRLNSHLKIFEEVLLEGGVCGKRLDFLVQEMNRETNTIGSKSHNTKITSLVVDLKCEIEKIREQIQNIE